MPFLAHPNSLPVRHGIYTGCCSHSPCLRVCQGSWHNRVCAVQFVSELCSPPADMLSRHSLQCGAAACMCRGRRAAAPSCPSLLTNYLRAEYGSASALACKLTLLRTQRGDAPCMRNCRGVSLRAVKFPAASTVQRIEPPTAIVMIARPVRSMHVPIKRRLAGGGLCGQQHAKLTVLTTIAPRKTPAARTPP